MHSNLCPDIYRKRLIIEGRYAALIEGEKFVSDFLFDLASNLDMHIISGPFISSATGKAHPMHDGYEGQVVWAESGASTYIWTRYNFCTVDIYSCKSFDTHQVIDFVTGYFQIGSFSYYEIPDPLVFDKDKRIEVRTTPGKGGGVFANDPIPQGTVLAYFDGPVMFAEREMLVDPYAVNHVLPFHKKFYRNSFNGQAAGFNHSCNPNCYVKDLFFMTAMRDIKKDEELTCSYSLFCNSDWQNPEGKCFCGSENCLGKILPWRDLPKEYKIKYLDYTADWILFEEMKKMNLVDNLKTSISAS